VVDQMLLAALLACSTAWQELSANGTWPAPRHGHSAVVSRERGWMLLFGGNMFDPVNHLFRYDFGRSEWAQLKLAGAPPKREGHSATVTAAGEMVVFGGYNGKFLNDVHVLNLTVGDSANASGDAALGWRQVEATGEAPAGRDGHTAVLAPDGATLLVFGGFDGKAQRSDTYALDTRSWHWRKLSTSPALGGSGDAEPPARCMHCAAWVGPAPVASEGNATAAAAAAGGADTAGGMLLYGGYSIDEETDADITHADVWVLKLAPAVGCSSIGDAAVWHKVEASGEGPRGGVFGHAAALDGSGRLWVHGGCAGSAFSDDLYVLERPLGEVRGDDTTGPGGEEKGEAAVVDEATPEEAGEEGGCTTSGTASSDTRKAGDDVLRGWAWRRVGVPGTKSSLPCARHKHSLVAAPDGSMLFLFGGVERGVARGFYSLDTADPSLSQPPRTLAAILVTAAMRLVSLVLMVLAAALRKAFYFRLGLALLFVTEQERITALVIRLRGGGAQGTSAIVGSARTSGLQGGGAPLASGAGATLRMRRLPLARAAVVFTGEHTRPVRSVAGLVQRKA